MMLVKDFISSMQLSSDTSISFLYCLEEQDEKCTSKRSEPLIFNAEGEKFYSYIKSKELNATKEFLNELLKKAQKRNININIEDNIKYYDNWLKHWGSHEIQFFKLLKTEFIFERINTICYYYLLKVLSPSELKIEKTNNKEENNETQINIENKTKIEQQEKTSEETPNPFNDKEDYKNGELKNKEIKRILKTTSNIKFCKQECEKDIIQQIYLYKKTKSFNLKDGVYHIFSVEKEDNFSNYYYLIIKNNGKNNYIKLHIINHNTRRKSKKETKEEKKRPNYVNVYFDTEELEWVKNFLWKFDDKTHIYTRVKNINANGEPFSFSYQLKPEFKEKAKELEAKEKIKYKKILNNVQRNRIHPEFYEKRIEKTLNIKLGKAILLINDRITYPNYTDFTNNNIHDCRKINLNELTPEESKAKYMEFIIQKEKNQKEEQNKLKKQENIQDNNVIEEEENEEEEIATQTEHKKVSRYCCEIDKYKKDEKRNLINTDGWYDNDDDFVVEKKEKKTKKPEIINIQEMPIEISNEEAETGRPDYENQHWEDRFSDN